MNNIVNQLIKVSNLRPLSTHLYRSLSTATCPATETQDIPWENARPFSEVPGPNLFQLFRMFGPGGPLNGKPLIDIQKEFQRRYGNLCKMPGVFGKPDMVFVYEPEDMEKVYRHEGQYPIREGLDSVHYFRRELRKDVFGKTVGLSLEQGEAWWDFRHKVNPVLMMPKATKVYVPKMDEISNDFVKKLQKSLNADGSAPDIFLPLLNKWALESVCYISLDIRIGLLGDEENPVAVQFMEQIKMFFEHMYKLDMLPSLWKLYKTPTFKASMKNMHEMTDIALQFLQQGIKALEEKKKRNDTADSGETGVLEKLLEIDENVALVMTLDSIMAGVDTTSSSVFQLFYALALYPEKQEILLNEILEVLPNEESKLTPENMKNMPYIRACMKESHRFEPQFDNLRSAGCDMVLQGYQIPKRTIMGMTQGLQMKNEVYYDQPDKFIPERFLRRNTKDSSGCPVQTKEAHPFIYLPFGFGPRMCIGRRFAELEMETLVCRLLQKYKLEWDGAPPTYLTSFGKIPIGRVNFKFTERK